MPQLCFLPYCRNTMEGHPTAVFWALSTEPGAGRTVSEAEQWGKVKARLAVLWFWSGLRVLYWLGCIPWGPVSAFWSSPNWKARLWLKVTLVSALQLQVLCCGSQRNSPGKGFFIPPLISLRPGSGPLWSLLHCIDCCFTAARD